MDYGFEAVDLLALRRYLPQQLHETGASAVQVTEELDRALLDAVAADPSLEITVDVARGTVEAPAAGLSGTFPLDEFTREPIAQRLGRHRIVTAFRGRHHGVRAPASRLLALPRDDLMVTFRPMEPADAPGAVAAFEGGLLTMLARHGLPVTGNSIQDERRRIDRTRHFLGTDPGGSWVAVDEGGSIIGVSQSFVREDYWMLSQLGAVPGVQGQGIGRELLRLALSHGDPQSPGTIQCSRDPKAMALYSGHGFHLHPVVAAWGIMRPGSVVRPDDVVRIEPDEVTERELDIVTAIDRAVRGSARTTDVVAMLAHPGNRLLLHGDQAYAVVADDRIVTLGARQEESAVLVLRTMLAEAPAGETIEINWLTSAQQWAIREVVAAGIELQPFGPVMVRGMDGPPWPYIPSGGYGYARFRHPWSSSATPRWRSRTRSSRRSPATRSAWTPGSASGPRRRHLLDLPR